MNDVSPKEKIWLSARNNLRKHLNEDIYNRWIRSIKPINYIEGKEFILGVSDEFYADWLEEHYTDFINDALRQACGKKISFRFEIGHDPQEYEGVNSEKEDKQLTNDEFREITNCNPKFIFDSFVVGDGNNFAYSAAKAVSQYPGISFNPLFIYGGTGLGKTHLIQASAHEALKINKNLKIEYLTCEEFFNFYIEALQNNRLSVFRKRFRNVDMLLIDDVQFLANKTKMQEEFFNTFNSLYNDNNQIVLTSDRAPSEIDGLENRLVSRFDNGLT
ncbi:MAG: ATP-binding protein, partial [Victivallales bacterium]|nr:ATP-binding protein [Victivallales bacterium]